MHIGELPRIVATGAVDCTPRWGITGYLYEWSGLEDPVATVLGDTHVITWLVLGLSFFHRYLFYPPTGISDFLENRNVIF